MPFETLVEEALQDLPAEFRRLLEDVAIVIEDVPDADQSEAGGAVEDGWLYGLYEGMPATEWGADMVAFPNKISSSASRWRPTSRIPPTWRTRSVARSSTSSPTMPASATNASTSSATTDLAPAESRRGALGSGVGLGLGLGAWPHARLHRHLRVCANDENIRT